MRDRAYLLGIWETADHMLKVAKALESRVRDDLAAELLSGESPDASGSFNFYIDDKEVTVTVAQSVTLEESEYDIHLADMTEEEIAAVKFRPTIDKKEFNKLPKDCILHQECVVIKTGKPTIKVLS